MCTTDGGAACLWVLLQVSPLRGVHGVLSWHDAALTTWICLLLLLLSLLLPLLPWYWIARAVGLAALGPHMYLLGAPAAAPKPSAAAPKLSPALRRLDAAERYARATDKEGRQAIVEEERRQRRAEVEAAQMEEQALKEKLPLSAHAKARRDACAHSGLQTLELHGSRLSSTKLDLATLPDPDRSLRVPAAAGAKPVY